MNPGEGAVDHKVGWCAAHGDDEYRLTASEPDAPAHTVKILGLGQPMSQAGPRIFHMKHVPNPSTVPNPAPGPIVIRIISGCQTGAARAALDVAMIRHLSHGGWCIHGRQAEDGPLPARYLLIETPSDDDLAHNVVPTK